ncbi:arsenate reductase, partial [Acinetobacter baumannii]
MLKIYGIKNCNSMKKAFDALQAKGLSYEFHDYKKQGIDADTLKIWLKE